MEILKLEKVKKVYKTNYEKVLALNNINLSIEDKEIIVILGPSGSGKSTLLNILSGIDNPSSGKVYFHNQRIDEYDYEKLNEYRKDNVGFIFQTYNLIANLTVYENVELGYQLSEKPLNILEILDILEIKRLKDKYPYQLSGGEMQRVAIARALVKNSSILFCDEPTGALDEVTGKKILSLLKKINKEYQTTIIIVTHNQAVAEMADMVIKMNSGSIIDIKHQKKKKQVEDLRWA